MSQVYDIPSSTQFTETDGTATKTWVQWLNITHNTVITLRTAGPTSERPTKNLWLGRTYFDTTLTKPIWIKQVTPAVLWCDATGATV